MNSGKLKPRIKSLSYGPQSLKILAMAENSGLRLLPEFHYFDDKTANKVLWFCE